MLLDRAPVRTRKASTRKRKGLVKSQRRGEMTSPTKYSSHCRSLQGLMLVGPPGCGKTMLIQAGRCFLWPCTRFCRNRSRRNMAENCSETVETDCSISRCSQEEFSFEPQGYKMSTGVHFGAKPTTQQRSRHRSLSIHFS